MSTSSSRIGESFICVCVFDYDARLAIGSHLFPGSSLSARLLNQNLITGGDVTVPLPVNQVLPQELSKDKTASQNTSYIWDVATSVSPARLDFANTVSPTMTMVRALC